MVTEQKLYLRQAQIGPMANFVYLVGDPETHKAAVVDPAWDVAAIVNFAQDEGYEIDKILISHYHQDHLGGEMMGHNIQGAANLLELIKAKVYVNKNEAEGAKRVSGLSDSDLVKVEAGDVAKVGNLEVKFLHTPGHTPGSQCFLVAGNSFLAIRYSSIPADGWTCPVPIRKQCTTASTTHCVTLMTQRSSTLDMRIPRNRVRP